MFDRSDHPLGELGGFPLTAKRQYRDNEPYALVDVVGLPLDSIKVSVGDIENPAAGLVVRFENALRTLDRTLASKHEWIDELTTEISRAQAAFGKPFQHQDALHAAYAARKEIDDKLNAAAAPPPVPAPVAAIDPDVAASLGVLASTHGATRNGERREGGPTGRPYTPTTVEPNTAPGLE
jgi:hypothetical protein